MIKSVKIILIVIGAFGVLAGVFSLINGADLMESYSGIFMGVVLMGVFCFIREVRMIEQMNDYFE